MAIYPTTIENGAGDRITFLGRVTSPSGERLVVENVLHPGGGLPMHVHHQQTETLTVRAGRLAWQRAGEAPDYAGPGETIVFRPGEAHRYWNPGEGELRCTSSIDPAGNAEYFLAALYDSQKRSGGKGPDPFDTAFLTRRYRSEFTITGVRPLEERFVFPLLLAVGSLFGKFDRFADAPQPVMR